MTMVATTMLVGDVASKVVFWWMTWLIPRILLLGLPNY